MRTDSYETPVIKPSDLSVSINKIREATHRHYSNLVEEGYSWVTNTGAESASECARKYMSGNSFVVVRDVAFDNTGKIMPNMRAILVKKVGVKR